MGEAEREPTSAEEHRAADHHTTRVRAPTVGRGDQRVDVGWRRLLDSHPVPVDLGTEAVHEFDTDRGRGGDLAFEIIRKPFVVVVEERQPLAARLRGSEVAR